MHQPAACDAPALAPAAGSADAAATSHRYVCLLAWARTVSCLESRPPRHLHTVRGGTVDSRPSTVAPDRLTLPGVASSAAARTVQRGNGSLVASSP
ncbi:hypothetical protein RJ55_05267 [Drechmeria coniospora]|nr:hypothetical protein RJ55_05267 [Drechmeria coniospora]